MDWGFIILVTLLIGWGAVVYYVNFRSKKGRSSADWTPDRPTPYEKYLSEHATDFNIRFQRGQVVRHRQLLREALKSGNQVATKIHRSMIVHGRSVVNYLLKQLK